MNTFLIFLLSSLGIQKDTGYVQIHLTIEGQESNFVRLERPLNNEVFLGTYRADNSIQQVGGKIFDFKVPYSSSSFFELRINNEMGYGIPLKSGDSVSIHLVRIPKSGYALYTYSFGGSNKEAHKIFQERFTPPGRNFGFFDDLSKKDTSYSSFYLKSKRYIDSLTAVWDSLRHVNLISKEVYDLYKADSKACLYNHAIKRLAKVNVKDSGSYKSFMEWNKIKQAMLFHSQAADPILRKVFIGQYMHQMYLRYIMDFDRSITDTILKKSFYSYFYYYDSTYREWAWGNTLYSMKRSYPTETDEDTYDLILFKKYYPNSIYTKKFENFKDSMIAERKNLVRGVPLIDSIDKNSLSEVFQNTTGRFFFIDVWATWCLPCIQEFTYQTSLTKFLEDKNIKEVFLSIDQERDKYKWQNFIKANFLPGYHFVLSNTAQKELIKLLSEKAGEGSLFIPRFLLYDKQANFYYLDLPRPSTGIGLQSALDSIIKKAEANN